MIELMKQLCALPGPSGCEDAVREFVLEKVKPFADEIKTDAIGNIMVFRKGKKALERPVVVCAHMDEVGVIIKQITDDGMLKFGFVGGVDPRVVIGRPVRLAITASSTRRLSSSATVLSRPRRLMTASAVLRSSSSSRTSRRSTPGSALLCRRKSVCAVRQAWRIRSIRDLQWCSRVRQLLISQRWKAAKPFAAYVAVLFCRSWMARLSTMRSCLNLCAMPATSAESAGRRKRA